MPEQDARGKRAADNSNAPCASKRKKPSSEGFARGSIVNIQVHNFMTYEGTSENIMPGPQLNLIIGPNGAGKSSMVCAISIGLGFTPKLLGRADHVREFVARGHSEAWTEITLSGGPNQEAYVIRRDLKLTRQGTTISCTTHFTVNGRAKKEAEVKKLVCDMDIQCDNLCQFLPQDKVTSFSQMTPVELLEATEEAIGKGELLRQHRELIKMREEIKQDEIRKTSCASGLKRLQDEHGREQRDYEKFQEKRRLEKEIAVLEHRKLWLEVEDRQMVANAAETAMQHASSVVQARRAEVCADDTPARQNAEAIKKTIAEHERKKRHCLQQDDIVKTACIKVANQDEAMEDQMKALAALADEASRRTTNIANQRRTIRDLEAEIAKLPTNINAQGLTDEERVHAEQATQRRAQHEEEICQARSRLEDLHSSVSQLQGEIQRSKGALLRLDDVRRQRLEALERNNNPGISAMHQWILENRPLFRGLIYGPVLLEITKLAQEHAGILEQHIGRTLSNFVSTCREDDKVLAEYKQRMGCKVVTACCDILAGRPIDHPAGAAQQYQQYGITHTLDQVFDAPDVIKHALCNLTHINTTYIGTQEIKANDVWVGGLKLTSRQAAEQWETLREQTNIRVLYTPTERYSCGVSRYNQAAKNSSTDGVRQPRLLGSAQSANDEARRQELTEIVERLQQDHTQCHERISEADVTLNELQMLRGQAVHLLKQIKDAGVARIQMRALLKGRLATNNTKLLKLEQSEDPMRKEEGIKGRLQTIIDQTVLMAEELMEKLAHQFAGVQDMAAVELQLRELQMQHDAMQAANRRAQAAVREAEQALANAQRQHGDALAARNAAKARAEEKGALTEEVMQRFAGLPADAAEVDAQLEQLQMQEAKISTNMSKVAMEAYLQREATIQSHVQELTRQADALATKQQLMDTVKNAWLPQLHQVVETINGSFGSTMAEMGCAGEVALQEHVDFDKFAMEIRAKFRNDEGMHVLTSGRQSGGERAVCTILYLMALQGVAKTPFRVVDEINQGMDPINERKVFAQLVESSCQPHTPQCFMLTPKLLPGLPFQKNITVLTIMNGVLIEDDVPTRFDKEEGLYGSRYNLQVPVVG